MGVPDGGQTEGLAQAAQAEWMRAARYIEWYGRARPRASDLSVAGGPGRCSSLAAPRRPPGRARSSTALRSCGAACSPQPEALPGGCWACQCIRVRIRVDQAGQRVPGGPEIRKKWQQWLFPEAAQISRELEGRARDSAVRRCDHASAGVTPGASRI